MPGHVLFCLHKITVNLLFKCTTLHIQRNRTAGAAVLTCRTKRSFRRILHGCSLTDCSTSLCSRMFSKICSLVESWWLVALVAAVTVPLLAAPSAYDSTALRDGVEEVDDKFRRILNIFVRSMH